MKLLSGVLAISVGVAALTAACSPAPTPATAPKAAETATVAPTPAKPMIADAWIATTAPGVVISAGYMTITNPNAADDTLVAAATPAAGKTELHLMEKDAATGAMKMRMADGGLPLPASGVATLAPGGAHLMFFDLKAPLAEGATIPITLTFAKAGAVETQLTVKPRTAAGAKQGGH